MLVLSRKASESVVIDGEIRVTVIKINGNKVRLGIEAPLDVIIKRSELSPLETTASATFEGEIGPEPSRAVA
jgi:carbon storage regulator